MSKLDRTNHEDFRTSLRMEVDADYFLFPNLGSSGIRKETGRSNAELFKVFSNLPLFADFLNASRRATGLNIQLRAREFVVSRRSRSTDENCEDRVYFRGEWIASVLVGSDGSRMESLPAMQQEGIVRLVKIFIELFSLFAERQIMAAKNSEPLPIATAKSFISKNATKGIDIHQAATAVGLSPDHLGGLFRKHSGLTFGGYLAVVRVGLAKQMLLDSKWRIAEIAFSTGFNSIPQFNRLFKKHTGSSPRDYRKKFHAVSTASAGR